MLVGMISINYLNHSTLKEAITTIPHYIIRLLIFGILYMIGFIILGIVFMVGFMVLGLIIGPLSFFFVVIMVFAITYITIRFTLVGSAIIIEDMKLVQAIKHSWSVTKGNVISIFAASLMIGLLFIIIVIPPMIYQFSKAIEMTSDPEIKEYIKDNPQAAQNLLEEKMAIDGPIMLFLSFVQTSATIISSLLCAFILIYIGPGNDPKKDPTIQALLNQGFAEH